jgi:hypothetical protein
MKVGRGGTKEFLLEELRTKKEEGKKRARIEIQNIKKVEIWLMKITIIAIQGWWLVFSCQEIHSRRLRWLKRVILEQLSIPSSAASSLTTTPIFT